MGYAHAFAKIEHEAAFGGAQGRAVTEQTQTSTVEQRMLRKHYRAMGIDDINRVMRADPRQHLFGCKCASCDKEERICPIEGCEKPVTGLRLLALHLERHRANARKDREAEKRAWRKRVEPAGMDFVTALLGNDDRAMKLDVRALKAFEEKLIGATGRRFQRRHAVARTLLADALADPTGAAKLTATTPNSIAAVVYRLALLAGTSPNAVATALLSWGIEKFAEDVRRSKLVAAPHVAKTLVAPQPPSASAFPNAEESAP